MSEDFLNALYRSRLFELFVPEFKNITGLVQHDQYHRYSVDAHLVQTIREVLRTKKSPRRMGRMGSIAKKLTHADWRILLWCALFHDIGKGGKGSHSETGESIAKKRLVALGQSLRETVEISWLVRNHLVLSGAAFRQNPQSPALWAELFSRGIKRDRINRLSVFTAIDIRATNPEAWNEWKDRLLTELCITLHSPTVGQLNKLLEKADKIRPRVKRQLVEQLPPEVVDGVRHQVLLQDLKNIQAVKHNLSPLVVKDSKGGVWVRLHSREDTPGLFLSFTQKIYSCGLNVMAAFVTTLPGYGAYDWFVVRSKRDLRWIRAQLDKAETMDLRQLPAVKFDVMEVISREDKTAIISLRGRDQEGALLHAAKALRSEDLIIHSAKVHTWGKQIDDIFTVAVGPDFEGQMSRLGNRLLPQGKLEL